MISRSGTSVGTVDANLKVDYNCVNSVDNVHMQGIRLVPISSSAGGHLLVFCMPGATGSQKLHLTTNGVDITTTSEIHSNLKCNDFASINSQNTDAIGDGFAVTYEANGNFCQVVVTKL
jgi:hypothetical protein